MNLTQQTLRFGDKVVSVIHDYRTGALIVRGAPGSAGGVFVTGDFGDMERVTLEGSFEQHLDYLISGLSMYSEVAHIVMLR